MLCMLACGGGTKSTITPSKSVPKETFSPAPTPISSASPSKSSSTSPITIPTGIPSITLSSSPSSSVSVHPTSGCTDNPLGWFDADGDKYDCRWYAEGNNCETYGNGYKNLDKTANEACCTCGGGTIRSQVPSYSASSKPSEHPTNSPTVSFTATPTIMPSDKQSSSTPCSVPSLKPSSGPSVVPSIVPSSSPSTVPSSGPSSNPSSTPSTVPSSGPSSMPSTGPSAVPSQRPSSDPTVAHSAVPSSQLSSVLSSLPSLLPSSVPSFQASLVPSLKPSSGPSVVPSIVPSSSPSTVPSLMPSSQPSSNPSSIPSSFPSFIPTSFPSGEPSLSAMPSQVPSIEKKSIPVNLEMSLTGTCACTPELIAIVFDLVAQTVSSDDVEVKNDATTCTPACSNNSSTASASSRPSLNRKLRILSSSSDDSVSFFIQARQVVPAAEADKLISADDAFNMIKDKAGDIASAVAEAEGIPISVGEIRIIEYPSASPSESSLPSILPSSVPSRVPSLEPSSEPSLELPITPPVLPPVSPPTKILTISPVQIITSSPIKFPTFEPTPSVIPPPPAGTSVSSVAKIENSCDCTVFTSSSFRTQLNEQLQGSQISGGDFEITGARLTNCIPQCSVPSVTTDRALQEGTRGAGDSVLLEIETLIVAEPGAVIPDVLPPTLVQSIKTTTNQVLEEKMPDIVTVAVKEIVDSGGIVVDVPVVGEVVTTSLVETTAAPTSAPTRSNNAKAIISDLKFDSTTRPFCLQAVNLRQNAGFKMRPCNNSNKQMWIFANDKIQNAAKPKWCMAWKGKVRELRVSECDGTMKTDRFTYDNTAKALVVTNITNGKQFLIGFNPRLKYNWLNLYGIKSENPSVHSFLLS
uniref:Ricin B lectin domain-containing protein n=1 Tax=Chaetoceros debilis TaxID=122233 RepID=A0A7S3VF40_9STRA